MPEAKAKDNMTTEELLATNNYPSDIDNMAMAGNPFQGSAGSLPSESPIPGTTNVPESEAKS